MADKIEDKKINEALDLLNELAKEKKAELQGMMSEKYSHLKSVLGGASERLQHQVKAGLEQGEETVKEFASTIDKSVHENPWPYLGSTALGFFILGLFLNRHKKSLVFS